MRAPQGVDTYTNITALGVYGLQGDDSFQVSSSAAVSVFIDGGDPTGIGDTLILVPTETPNFTPAQEGDEGAFSFATHQTVSFDRIESATVDLVGVPGQSAIISGTGGDDHITATGVAIGSVEVQVNDGPIVTYSNATALTLRGLNGDDDLVISPNLAGPGVAFTAEGGSSTQGSDTLTVIGVAGAIDPMIVVPTAQGSGTVVNLLGLAGNVAYAGIEDMELVGQLADADNFGVDGTAGNDIFQYHVGNTPSDGRVQGSMNLGGAGTFTLPNIRFQGMDPITGTSFNIFGQQGGVDAFIYFGTDSNDLITYGGGILTNAPGGILISNINTGTPANLGTTLQVAIDANDGDDIVNITPQALVAILVEGDDPSIGSDVLNFNGTGGAITADMTSQSLTEVGLGPVIYMGMEQVNINGAGGALAVNGTADNDTFSVTPLGASLDGRFLHDRTPAVRFAYNAVSGITFLGGLGGDDVVAVFGDEGIDAVTSAASSVTVDGTPSR